MKVDLSLIMALTLGGITLLSKNSYGQDDGLLIGSFQEPVHQELNLNEDKSLIFENENRPTQTIQSIQRDTLSNRSGISKKTNEKKKKKKKDDAMSFNFLYYIIQRYKISDIVDQ